MSIYTVRSRLATLQRAIPGIVTANAQLPKGSINTADLPLFMTFVRDADYNTEALGSDDVLVTRTYLMWLMVKPVAEGESGEGEALVEPYVETVSNYFLSRPTLNNLIGIVSANLISDTGPKRMVWPGTPTNPIGVYWGAEFRLDVIETKEREYVDY